MTPTDERPVVAQVNYLYFLSTQSFIYFYLAHLRRYRPICLTRAPESPVIDREIPEPLARDFHIYGDQLSPGWRRTVWSTGLLVRRALTRLPPNLARPALGALNDWIVPWLRPDTDPERYVDWAGDILTRERARLIHAYFGPVGWRMLALKRRLGLPLVVTFLGDEIAPQLAPWWWWFVGRAGETPDWPARLRELLAGGDLFLVEGPFLRQQVIDLGCPPEKVVVQRIALPLGEMPSPVPAPHARPNGKLVILFAGRFCERKGVLDALDAVARVWAERRDIEFRMIGDDTLTDGNYAARVYDAIRTLRLQDCVRLLGFVGHDVYLRELAAADVFLHPSLVDDDGLSEGGAPTTILEAQALGIPVVATLHCDIPNVTIPGESALLVPERDPAALADALRQLLDDPDRRARMGHAGRAFVAAHHDIARAAPLLEERYDALLGRGAAPRG
jgi:colanic acid/amylovoran biosynthesis glycosyltransferase